MTTTAKEGFDSLKRVLVYDVERARPIGSPRIVAQIQKIVMGKSLPDFVQDGKASVSRIEDSYGAGLRRKPKAFIHGARLSIFLVRTA